MFERVLIALDGSERSEAAIPAAKALAEQSGGSIVVAHVDERTVAKGDLPPVHPDEVELLEKVKAQAESIGATIESDSVVLGGPALKIAEIAERVGADVIVVGSRGESALKGVVLGSVAHRLLHVAPCPVLVVPVR
jgi:nucleotide-binding universal stress UspA family protein